MDKKHTHCGTCGKKFRKNTEVVVEKTGGHFATLHVRGTCHYQWLLRFSISEYHDNWREMAIEENII